MLSQQPELAPKKVSALFPGDFCYPLTPKGNKKIGDDAKDQLKTILETMGPQHDLSFIESKAGQQFVEGIQKGISGNSSQEQFIKVLKAQDPALQELMLKMLEVNPNKRWTAAECLESNYFDEIRYPSIERGAISQLLLDIDKNDAFDYNKALSEKYTRKDYMDIIWKECQKMRLKRIAKLKLTTAQ